MKRISRVESRRTATRQKVKEILGGMASGRTEIYVGYRQLYQCWRGNNTAIPELRSLFRLPGSSPDGRLTVDDSFKAQVLKLVKSIATQFLV